MTDRKNPDDILLAALAGLVPEQLPEAPIRNRLRDSILAKARKPAGKPQAHSKAWQELLGQVGGPVRRPLLALTEAERAVVADQFARSGLRLK